MANTDSPDAESVVSKLSDEPYRADVAGCHVWKRRPLKDCMSPRPVAVKADSTSTIRAAGLKFTAQPAGTISAQIPAETRASHPRTIVPRASAESPAPARLNGTSQRSSLCDTYL